MLRKDISSISCRIPSVVRWRGGQLAGDQSAVGTLHVSGVSSALVEHDRHHRITAPPSSPEAAALRPVTSTWLRVERMKMPNNRSDTARIALTRLLAETCLVLAWGEEVRQAARALL